MSISGRVALRPDPMRLLDSRPMDGRLPYNPTYRDDGRLLPTIMGTKAYYSEGRNFEPKTNTPVTANMVSIRSREPGAPLALSSLAQNDLVFSRRYGDNRFLRAKNSMGRAFSDEPNNVAAYGEFMSLPAVNYLLRNDENLRTETDPVAILEQFRFMGVALSVDQQDSAVKPVSQVPRVDFALNVRGSMSVCNIWDTGKYNACPVGLSLVRLLLPQTGVSATAKKPQSFGGSTNDFGLSTDYVDRVRPKSEVGDGSSGSPGATDGNDYDEKLPPLPASPSSSSSDSKVDFKISTATASPTPAPAPATSTTPLKLSPATTATASPAPAPAPATSTTLKPSPATTATASPAPAPAPAPSATPLPAAPAVVSAPQGAASKPPSKTPAASTGTSVTITVPDKGTAIDGSSESARKPRSTRTDPGRVNFKLKADVRNTDDVRSEIYTDDDDEDGSQTQKSFGTLRKPKADPKKESELQSIERALVSNQLKNLRAKQINEKEETHKEDLSKQGFWQFTPVLLLPDNYDMKLTYDKNAAGADNLLAGARKLPLSDNGLIVRIGTLSNIQKSPDGMDQSRQIAFVHPRDADWPKRAKDMPRAMLHINV